MPMPKGHKNPKAHFATHPEDINKKGRPKVGLALGELVREVMEEPNRQTKKTKVESLIDVAINRAMKGQWQFWDSLMARGYGKVPDKIEMTQDEKPDLSKLTDKELEQYTALLKKALG